MTFFTVSSRRRPSAPPGCRRRKAERAGLALDTRIDKVIAELAELRVTAAAHRDDARADAADDRQDLHDFGRLAAVGDGDDDIVLRHHTEVAVKGLSRMQEERRRARARERRRNLAADMAGLAHARHDDTGLAGQDILHSLDKFLIDARLERQHGIRLDLQRLHSLFFD